jgi:hypothetical protein
MATYAPPEDDEEGGGKKKRKAKKTKDPNAPKQPLTAYFYFVAHEREAAKSQHPGVSTSELAKILGAKWKELGAPPPLHHAICLRPPRSPRPPRPLCFRFRSPRVAFGL